MFVITSARPHHATYDRLWMSSTFPFHNEVMDPFDSFFRQEDPFFDPFVRRTSSYGGVFTPNINKRPRDMLESLLFPFSSDFMDPFNQHRIAPPVRQRAVPPTVPKVITWTTEIKKRPQQLEKPVRLELRFVEPVAAATGKNVNKKRERSMNDDNTKNKTVVIPSNKQFTQTADVEVPAENKAQQTGPKSEVPCAPSNAEPFRCTVRVYDDNTKDWKNKDLEIHTNGDANRPSKQQQLEQSFAWTPSETTYEQLPDPEDEDDEPPALEEATAPASSQNSTTATDEVSVEDVESDDEDL